MSSGDPMSAPPRRVTSADVARACGVSRATVSYVLNNTPNRMISERTRELVLRTAKELGFVPFAPARSLRLGQSNIVLALVRDFGLGFITSEVLKRLDHALVDRGHMLLAHRLDERLRPLNEVWQLVSPTMVVAMGGLSVAEQALIDVSSTKLLRLHGRIPHELAGRMQAEYLYERGHRALGYAFHSAENLALVANERLDGVQDTAKRLGMPDPVLHTVRPDDPATAFSAVDAWLAAGVTAVAAHNDELALMVTEALTARGLRAGPDLAVIGVDDIPTARINLTTIGIDVEAWGQSVVDAVLATLDGHEPEHDDADFLRLIVRASA